MKMRRRRREGRRVAPSVSATGYTLSCRNVKVKTEIYHSQKVKVQLGTLAPANKVKVKTKIYIILGK